MREIMALALALAVPVLWTADAPAAFAQNAIKVERVNFRPGQSSTVITRTIRGYETIDFLVNARAGQRLEASMTSSNSAAYFNVLEPGQTNEAVYNGSMSSPTNSIGWTLQNSGDLRVRVYLYRNAARRGETANIRLSIAVTGSAGNATQLPGLVPGGGGNATQLPGQAPGGGGSASQLPGDVLVPGTNYNATGELSCRMLAVAPMRNCPFGVIRIGNGSATVTVARPMGGTRTITFREGRAIGYDHHPGETARMTTMRQADQTVVQIAGERYVIFDAIVFGG